MATTINTISVNSIPSVTDTGLYTAATNTATVGAEIFEARLDAADGKWFIEIDNTESGSKLEIALVGGSYVGARTGNIGSINPESKAIIYVDSSMCKGDDGMIYISVKPKVGSLAANNVKLHLVQLLPVENK